MNLSQFESVVFPSLTELQVQLSPYVCERTAHDDPDFAVLVEPVEDLAEK